MEGHATEVLEIELDPARPAGDGATDLVRKPLATPLAQTIDVSREDATFLVAGYEEGVTVAQQVIALCLERPEEKIAATDDNLGVDLIYVSQHRFKGGRVAMNVVKDRSGSDHTPR